MFDGNGHLTDEGLCALHNETLNEGQRLAVSEHLCACDGCLARYTASLHGPALIEPPQPLGPSVAARLAKRGGHLRSLGARGLAVAVCLAVGLCLMAMLAAPAHKTPALISPVPADELLLLEGAEGSASSTAE